MNRVAWMPLRCFYPLAAIAIIAGTLVWGAWASLAVALVLWRAVGRWA